MALATKRPLPHGSSRPGTAPRWPRWRGSGSRLPCRPKPASRFGAATFDEVELTQLEGQGCCPEHGVARSAGEAPVPLAQLPALRASRLFGQRCATGAAGIGVVPPGVAPLGQAVSQRGRVDDCLAGVRRARRQSPGTRQGAALSSTVTMSRSPVRHRRFTAMHVLHSAVAVPTTPLVQVTADLTVSPGNLGQANFTEHLTAGGHGSFLLPRRYRCDDHIPAKHHPDWPSSGAAGAPEPRAIPALSR